MGIYDIGEPELTARKFYAPKRSSDEPKCDYRREYNLFTLDLTKDNSGSFKVTVRQKECAGFVMMRLCRLSELDTILNLIVDSGPV